MAVSRCGSISRSGLKRGFEISFKSFASSYLYPSAQSGATLLRVLLSTHPSVRCGPETHVVIDLLKLRYEWANFPHLKARNEAAGVTQQIIDKVS